MTTTIETDLKEILGKIDQRLDRIDQRLGHVEADLTEMRTDFKVSQAKMETEITTIKDDVKDLKGRASAQIWTLIISIVGALAAGVIKFGFFSNP